MSPSTLPLIILIEYALIVEPEDSVTDWRGGRRVNEMCEIISIPDPDCWLMLCESGEIYVLTMSRALSVEFGHPFVGSVKSDGF